MRSEDEIVRAHDLLNQVIKGQVPEAVEIDRETDISLIAAEDVLCWVLCHDHSSNFEHNLQALRVVMDEAGYDLHKVDGPEAATERSE